MVENISKLDAAGRQLKTAIRLLLGDKDMLAVHTLVGAAHEILVQIALGGDEKKLDRNVFVKRECRLDFSDRVRRARNYLKHADWDAGATLEFHTTNTVFWLCDALWMHWHTTGKLCPERVGFLMWFVKEHPSVLEPSAFPGACEVISRLPPTPTLMKDVLTIVDNPTYWQS